jgi:hypothetical protein
MYNTQDVLTPWTLILLVRNKVVATTLRGIPLFLSNFYLKQGMISRLPLLIYTDVRRSSKMTWLFCCLMQQESIYRHESYVRSFI